ncbi:MAG: DNA polymerase III subunit delta [Treponema sp.]|jgi:DNA polymerase-3 subunit delta|nr:DNA polymerase III subunit delta [Treponema sp.]
MQSCLLFLGPEIGEKQDAVAEIRRTLQDKGAPPEETSFYAGETPAAAMTAIMRNGALFAEKRLFFIKNAENLKKKDEIDILVDYMSVPQQNTVLVVISDETTIAKPLENAVPPNAKRIFWEMFENRKREWVLSFFKRKGFSITEDGIDAILEMVENNTQAFRRECSHLCRFLDKGKPVKAEDVEEWLSHTRAESAFTLFSRLATGDLAKSLETMHTLLMAKEAPPAILAGLAWCFQKLRDYLFLIEEHKVDGPSDVELRKIGLTSPRTRKDYENARRRYNVWQADLCVSLTAEYDMLARSMGAGLENLLMDRYVYKLWVAGAGCSI